MSRPVEVRTLLLTAASATVLVLAGCSSSDLPASEPADVDDTPLDESATTQPSTSDVDEEPVPLGDGSWRELAQDDGSFHPDEWAEAQAACVREQGFAAEGDNAERSVRFEPVPDDQQEAAQEAITSCQQQVQIDPRFNEDPDEQQLEATYDWYVNETIPCLEDEGFEGNWDVPTFETFAARWPTAEQWNPWLQLTVPVAEVERAQVTCPGIPFDELWE